MSKLPEWLESAVFYQIYPQSFKDSNNDGIGDLPGIIQKLDYLQSLGITGIWINPCFESPFMDAGYDVSDYYKVAARYGTNEDLKNLFQEARQRGIHVLLDLVPGHTSMENPWFKESCRHERNPYSDYYIWNESAWSWEIPGFRVVSGHAERDAAFITNFFYFQPALNYGFANPDPRQPWQQPVDAPGPQAVRREMRKIMQFWLEMGASGFRVDMAGSLVKNDPGGKETARLWQEMRAWLDRDFPEAVLLAEWAQPATSIPGGFHLDFVLPFGMPGYHSLYRKAEGPGPGSDPYGFSFFDKAGHGNVLEFLDNYLPHYHKSRDFGHIAIPSGNHDTGPRPGKGRSADDLEVIYAFLLTMPGTPFIYYGDEIGMRGVYGLPSKEGSYNRTAIRTPMQWDDTTNAGFSNAPANLLYLPIEPDADRPTVADQEQDPGSILNRIRRLIEIRKKHPALCASGGFEVVFAQPGKTPFVYARTSGKETVLVALNPAARTVEVPLPDGWIQKEPMLIHGDMTGLAREGETWVLRLPPVSTLMIQTHP